MQMFRLSIITFVSSIIQLLLLRYSFFIDNKVYKFWLFLCFYVCLFSNCKYLTVMYVLLLWAAYVKRDSEILCCPD